MIYEDCSRCDELQEKLDKANKLIAEFRADADAEAGVGLKQDEILADVLRILSKVAGRVQEARDER